MIYLDHAATTKPYKEVTEVQALSMDEEFFNPSSSYKVAKDLARKITSEFQSLAQDLDCSPDELIHTSGATEASNHVIKGLFQQYGRRLNHFVCLASDHDCTLKPLESIESLGAQVSYLKPTKETKYDLEELSSVLNNKTLLVNILYVNNESGTLQAIEKICALIRERAANAFILGDFVQAWGKVEFSMRKIDVDFAIFSGHKIHGPKGNGLLYFRGKSLPTPLIHGGGQQNNMRSGTENLAGLRAMAMASRMQKESFTVRKARTQKFRDKLANHIERLGGIINFPHSIPEIMNVSFPGLRGETILHMLEAKEVFISTSSACQARSGRISHVLEAIAMPRIQAEGSIRISLDGSNTPEEIEKFCILLENEVTTLRQWQGL